MVEIYGVKIEVIPHSRQRYETLGDWFYEIADGKPTLVIRVSSTGDWRSDMLVALHELVEALLCRHAGVEQELVDNFDMTFVGDEPGDSVAAPYRDQHCFAMAVERMLCAAMRMAWVEHEKRLENVSG